MAQCKGSGRINKLAHFAGLGCADDHQLNAFCVLGEIGDERTVSGNGANVHLRIVRRPNRDIAIKYRSHPAIMLEEYAIILEEIESRSVGCHQYQRSISPFGLLESPPQGGIVVG